MARKGLLIVILVLCISLTFVLPSFAEFRDVPSSHWAGEQISHLVSRDIISGFVDGSYRPDDLVTRAQMATLVSKAKNLPLTSAAEGMSFTDIPPGYWASTWIKACTAAGIVKGYTLVDGASVFKPADPVTRGELARMLRRASGMPVLKPVNPKFSDVSIGYWAFDEIETVAYHGIMGGYPDGTFRPANKVTRAEVAVALYKLINANLVPPTTDLPSETTSTPDSTSTAGDGKITIVIDPGHGGYDPGAVSRKDGEVILKEKDVNLAVALKLRDLLESAGFYVVMTRTTDVSLVYPYDKAADLRKRAEIANSAKADIFISIHHNASESTAAAGTSVYHYPGSQDGALLASFIQQELVEAFGWAGVSGKDDGIHSANFAVLRETTMPAALSESAFMSNPEEAALLATDEFRQKEAQGIYNGIIKYFSQPQ